MNSILGTSKDALQLHTVDENRETVIQMAQQAQRELVIFSQELDAMLYNNQAFERAIVNLAKRHPGTQIRILVQDATRAIHDGHCLLRLAQSLTSSVFIRKPGPDHANDQGAFLVADGIGFLQRVVGNQYNYEALANFMAPLEARQLADYFNKAWEHAEEVPGLRRLYV